MKTQTDCDLNSYRINRKSSYKKYVNEFVLRIIENGLYDKHLQWSTALFNAIFRPPGSPPPIIIGTKQLVLTLTMISGVFDLFFVGVTLSCIAFLFEYVYVKCLRKLLKLK